MIDAGKLNKRIELQSRVTVVNDYGERVLQWVTYATKWAGVRMLSGNELVSGNEIQSQGTIEIIIRYFADVKVTHRVIYNGRTFDINAVLEIDDHTEALKLICGEKK